MERIVKTNEGTKYIYEEIYDPEILKQLNIDCEREYKKVLEKVKEYKETERP